MFLGTVVLQLHDWRVLAVGKITTVPLIKYNRSPRLVIYTGCLFALYLQPVCCWLFGRNQHQ